jgi:hypothetical protein
MEVTATYKWCQNRTESNLQCGWDSNIIMVVGVNSGEIVK